MPPEEKRRHGRSYVFARLAREDEATLDALDVTQRKLYVLETAALDERLKDQRSTCLSRLPSLQPHPGSYAALGDVIRRVEARPGCVQARRGCVEARPGCVQARRGGRHCHRPSEAFPYWLSPTGSSEQG